MDLNKLTVPQLKVLCKDKKITGYSKLNKPALIAKLQQHGGSSGNTVPACAIIPSTNASSKQASAPVPPQTERGPVSSSVPPASGKYTTSAPRAASGTADSAQTRQVPVTITGPESRLRDPSISISATSGSIAQRPQACASVQQPSTATPGAVHTHIPSAGRSNTHGLPTPTNLDLSTAEKSRPTLASPTLVTKPTARKRKNPKDVLENPKTKQSKKIDLVTTTRATRDPLAKHALLQPKPIPVSMASSTVLPDATPIPTVTISAPEIVAAPPRKKAFAPLVPKLPPVKVIAPLAVSNRTQIQHLSTKENAERLSGFGNPSADVTLDSVCDFTFPAYGPPPVLHPVSLPPSISQRKKVQKLSLILSLVFQEDLVTLSQLSRLHRYSAYVAASHVLRREFPGRQLDNIFKKYSPNMMNFWPYLRQRRQEVLDRRQRFGGTFLGRALTQYPSIVGARLWNTENVKELGMSVKFLMTCFYYQISVGLDVQFHQTSILSAQEVIEGEIWKVAVRIGLSTHYYYVLEATCEVVGLPGISCDDMREVPNPDRRGPCIRADWTDYVERRLSDNQHTVTKTLLDHLSWPNHEEYDKGISKNWLSRVRRESESGIVKLEVAHRYVLACLVANSLSGRVMSSTEMEQEFNGTAVDQGIFFRAKKRPNLSLFLPSHHMVESVHTTSQKATPLHPAIAVVQTPGREYYVLRDNGMQIGCEEDGISPVWMAILQCDERGVFRSVSIS